MTKKQGMLVDPWCDHPHVEAYMQLALAGIAVDSSMSDLQQAYYELLEHGMVTDATREAFNQLRIAGRRLAADALCYDVEASTELLELLREPLEEFQEAKPLHQQVPLSWNA